MNHSFIHKLLGLTLLVGVVLAVATPSHAAERVRQRHATTVKTANGRTTTGSVTGERGKASTFRSTTAHHGSGVTTRATTLTSPRGKSTERELSRQINADETDSPEQERLPHQPDHSMNDEEPTGWDQAPNDIHNPRHKRHPRTEGKGGLA